MKKNEIQEIARKLKTHQDQSGIEDPLYNSICKFKRHSNGNLNSRRF